MVQRQASYGLDKVLLLQVKYGKSLIGGASHPATFVRVYDICGPTYPGEFEAKARTYTLHYPGLAFLFPIPPQHAEAVSENHIGMPLEFPDGSTPLAARICIYTASEGNCTTRIIQLHTAATLYRTHLYRLVAGVDCSSDTSIWQGHSGHFVS